MPSLWPSGRKSLETYSKPYDPACPVLCMDIDVCDNLNTHTKGAFYEAFDRQRARELVRRIQFCDTPKT